MTTRQFAALNRVQITDGFWRPYLDKLRTVTLPELLDKFEAHGYLDNYDAVAAGKRAAPGEELPMLCAPEEGPYEGLVHYGFPWADGLVCETIRAAGDFLAAGRDPALEARVDGYARRMAAAQAASGDGYLNTYTAMAYPERRWGENGGFLIHQHDCYNAGCLCEAAVHYYRATGKTELLAVACRMANCMCAHMGPPPRQNVVPAHSLPEEAVLKLGQLLRDDRALDEFSAREHADWRAYLELSTFWLEARGHNENRVSNPRFLGEYAQDHRPLAQQRDAVGHAVRAMLLYTGLSAAACDSGRQDWAEAARGLWHEVTRTKYHVSGGVGARTEGESFGYVYELPENAYLETCAGVAFALWAGELHRLTGMSECFDRFEQTLWGNVLSALSEDGRRWFYENPLISDGSRSRWDWHVCPCCPPMFLKLLAALPGYVFTLLEQEISVNLPIDAVLTQPDYTLVWQDGKVTVRGDSPVYLTVRLRVPDWARNVRLLVNGRETASPVPGSYAAVTQTWDANSSAELRWETPILRMEAHPWVASEVGRVAVMRAGKLYCAEACDNPEGTDFTLSREPLRYADGAILGTTAQGTPCRLIPYHTWNNRAQGTMRVWLRQEGKTNSRSLEGWEDRLYRPYRI